jgi:hypothetical protein
MNMERQLANFAHATSIGRTYRVRIADFEEVVDAPDRERSLSDKCLGIATMVVVSVGGWAAIIGLIRLLW